MNNWTDPARRSEVVNISSTDYTFTLTSIAALHNATNAGGTVTARLWGDSVDSVWYLNAGAVVPGCFQIIRKTGTTLTAAAAILGLSPMASNT